MKTSLLAREAVLDEVFQAGPVFPGKAIGVEQLMGVPRLLVEKHLADRHFVDELKSDLSTSPNG